MQAREPREPDAGRGDGNRRPIRNVNVPEFCDAWAWFLDVDGTLLDFADHPDHVEAPPQLLRLLGDLRDASGGAVAVVSGRAIAEIDRIFAGLRLACAGQHGFERRGAGGAIRREQLERGPLEAVRKALTAFVETHPGTLLEDKDVALALHFRRVPAVEARAQALAECLRPRLGPGYHLQCGKMVLEFKPAGHHKGLAVADLMAQPPFRDRVPVFIGDDITDEDGFRTAMALGGHAIKVGAGASIARWRLPDAASVLRWLQGYVSFRRTCHAAS
jgi:trehalose 6-phosphate phosphatase